MSLYQELKRRNVFRVGLAYVLMGWVLLQGADFVLDLIGAPDWVIRTFALAVVIGLPIALFFAWAFEMTPEGIKREHEVDRSASIAPQTGRKLNSFIIGALVLVIVLMAVERFYNSNSRGQPEPDQVTVQAGPPKSIGVLPFADLSQSQDQVWFADGLAEEILNALVKVPDLQVAARTSSFQFKGTNKSISEIARELGVAHVLEGSVRSGADRIRVTAQLIRASDGFHLWSQNYDRDIADMIGIQEDLARNIANALETSMDPNALAQMAQVGTDSVEAYQEYLRGIQLQNDAFTSDAKDLDQAYQHFERARQIDPGFFDAHVQAANYWKVELTPSRTDSGTSEFEPAQMLRAFNERIGLAIENARNEGDRIRSLAERALIDLRLREARGLFEQYMTLRPNDELVRFELEGVLGMLSENEAIRKILPIWKEKGQTDIFAASSYINEAYRVIDPSVAADFGLQAVQRWPNSAQVIYQAHRTLVWAGRYREASELAARYEMLVPGSSPLVRGREACAAGDREAAEQILKELSTSSEQDISVRWLMLNMLGNTQEEVDVLRPLEQSGVPYQLASFLGYTKFDPRPYPSLMAVLEREGVKRPPPVVPPFRCPPPAEISVAVLPFVNMSADAEQEYFSDGMTEEIINALVRIPDIKVAARTSVFALKGQQKDVREMGRDLNVSHVLEGSVRSDGNQLRITAQLIQVEDGFHLWSDTFDRERVKVFAIQEEIANAIAGVLSEQFKAAPVTTEKSKISIAAYDNYLRGRAHLRARSAEDLEQAEALFKSVTDAHPDYAPAWAALAITEDVADDHAAAERSALRALEIDPDNVDALNALGGVYRDTMRWSESEAMLERAMAIDPDSAELLEDYAEFLANTGRVERQLEIAARGYAIDPYLDPLVDVYAGALLSAGENELAVEVLDRALARGAPTWLLANKISALSQAGETDAIRSTIMDLSLPETQQSAFLAAVQDPSDSAALGVIRNTLMTETSDYMASLAAEVLLLHLADPEPVIDAYLDRLQLNQWVSAESWFIPNYSSFRAHPRFVQLLELTGLPAYWDQTGWPAFCERDGDDAISCH